MTTAELVESVCRAVCAPIPYEGLQEYAFLRHAFVTLLLVGPLCSTVGIQVVHFRLAFFSEAVGHSAYTGLGLGLLLGYLTRGAAPDPVWTMVGFGALVALSITAYLRRGRLSSDTVIGVFSATIIAVGLCVIKQVDNLDGQRSQMANLQTWLIGSPLTITPAEIAALAAFFVVAMTLQVLTYNRLLLIGLNRPLAQTMGLRVKLLEYTFAVLLGLVVMFSIRAIGILLVTALLVIPAAAARNLARSAGGAFWWGMLVSVSSCLGGFFLSDLRDLPTGASAVLIASGWFVLSSLLPE